MKRNILLILILVMSFIALAQRPKKLYKTGIKMVEANQVSEAINQFDQAIQLDSFYIDAYVARAKAYESIDKLELSAKDYEKAVELQPQIVDYIFSAGKLNYKIKNYEKSLEYLKEAVILDDNNFQAYQYKSFTHIKLKEYKKGIVAIDNALAIQKTYICYYARGVANDSLGNYLQAITDYNKAINLNSSYKKAFYALTYAYLHIGDFDKALENANRSVQNFSGDATAYKLRSLVYYSRNELPSAINDLSKLETLVDDSKQVLFTRGMYYFEYKQYQNAKSDFSQIIALNPQNYEALYWRGRANEELMEEQAAERDYVSFITFSKSNNSNNKLLKDANSRLFEINREDVAPIVAFDSPMVMNENKFAVLDNANQLLIAGSIKDNSKILSLSINSNEVVVNSDKTFSYMLDIADINTVKLVVNDVYKNTTTLEYGLLNVEADAPIVKITSPYADDDNDIYLDSGDANLFVEGFIEDESNIKDIFIDNIRASFNDAELNPQFSATVNIENRNTIMVTAIDDFGNTTTNKFTLNREGAFINENNPMGKTWVVFIENSNYETFAKLEGPSKDASLMKSALSNYEIHNFIHKKDMSKMEMERFFSIELRDQVKKNNVNSLLVWYAGHGKYINETGYWIPVDATRNDEFTYFNINSLKAGMQSYNNYITHTLIVTDACESGPSFYMAMRSTDEVRECDDINATKFKSAQVFSSAGNERASDNSQFTKVFAKSLQYNQNACIPIESIVIKVTEATESNKNQKPLFGKIAGFEDEGGTFFFIKK